MNYYISLASFGEKFCLLLRIQETLSHRISVVLYYDYFMTLDQEIKFFWNKKLNVVNILFFVNRYLSIFGTVPVILQNFGPWSEKVSIPNVTLPGSNTNSLCASGVCAVFDILLSYNSCFFYCLAAERCKSTIKSSQSLCKVSLEVILEGYFQ